MITRSIPANTLKINNIDEKRSKGSLITGQNIGPKPKKSTAGFESQTPTTSVIPKPKINYKYNCSVVYCY